MNKKPLILGIIVIIIIFFSIIYIYFIPSLQTKGLLHIYYISPDLNNTSIINLTEFQQNDSLPSKYETLNNDSNRRLERYSLHNNSYRKPVLEESFKVLMYIYSNESYIIGRYSLKYEFHFFILEFPNGSVKLFSITESHPPRRYTGIEDTEHPNFNKHKTTLTRKAEDDFQELSNLIFNTNINITDQFVPYYYT